MNRAWDDVAPYFTILQDNWYDTVHSIAEATADELHAAGIPMRFGKELIIAASSGSGSSSTKVERGPFKRYREEDSGKGDWGGNDSGKGKKADRDAGKGGKNKGKTGKGGDFAETLEFKDIDPGFKAVTKVIGREGKNSKHISQSTGAHLHVSDTENGGWDVRIDLSAPTQSQLDDAVNMVSDLLQTVWEDYEEWQLNNGEGDDPSRGKGKGKSKSKGKDSKDKGKAKGDKGYKGAEEKGGKGKDRSGGDHQHTINVEAPADPNFRMAGKIVGPLGSNVKHIGGETGARLAVKTGDDGATDVHVSAPSREALDRATDMVNDLLSSVWEEYEEWQAKFGAERGDNSDGKSKGKGKSNYKGKDKGKGKYDEPEYKRRREEYSHNRTA